MKSTVKYIFLIFAIALLSFSHAFSQQDSTNVLSDSTQGTIAQGDRAQELQDTIQSNLIGYPVVPFLNDTLFLIYNRLGSLSAEQRAKLISERIKSLDEEFKIIEDSLILDSTDLFTNIKYKSIHLISISDEDAAYQKMSRNELAEEYKTIIKTAARDYLENVSIFTLLKKAGLAVIVIIVLVFIIKLINRLFRWTEVKIEEQEGKLIKGIKIRTYTLYDIKSQVKVIKLLNNVLRWFVIVVSAYIALPVLFGIFPWTEKLASTLIGFILDPLKEMLVSFWDFLPNLFAIIVIIIVFRYILKLIKYLKSEIAIGRLRLPGFYPDWANPTYHIIRIVILAFMVVVIFPYLPGSDSPVFQGVSVFLGFLFTFGSAGSLSNIIAGLVLTYMRLFRKGDRVKIGEVVGDVIEKSMLVTRVRTIKNEIISIPNATVMNSHTINYSSDAPDKGLVIYSTITIGYDVPWKEIHQALIDAALKTEFILEDPAPFVLQTSLDDFYVSYQINAYTKEPNKQAAIYSELHKNIQDVCNEREIEIMSPHFRAVRDGNTPAVPTENIPKGFVIPSFRFSNTGKDKGDLS
jgi:small-conductance mechanosensitive channel